MTPRKSWWGGFFCCRPDLVDGRFRVTRERAGSEGSSKLGGRNSMGEQYDSVESMPGNQIIVFILFGGGE